MKTEGKEQGGQAKTVSKTSPRKKWEWKKRRRREKKGGTPTVRETKRMKSGKGNQHF